MYQTFTGSARRPRQVNLSGRPTNPFAAASSAPTSGSQSAVASAERERAARQRKREELQASARIQKVWRGHSARRRTFRAWRQIWDELEEQASAKQQRGAYANAEESLTQLRRLLLFFRGREGGDRKRLGWYGMRQMATADAVRCEGGPWPEAYLKLERACISSLRLRDGTDTETDRVTLMTLAFAARRTTLREKDATEYYDALMALREVHADALQNALLAPLQSSPEAYVGLAVLLSRPLAVDMMDLLRVSIDSPTLVSALASIQEHRLGDTARARLWLLGNTIFLAATTQASDSFTAIISRLLGSLADEVDFEGTPIDMENVSFDQDVLRKVSSGLPLNKFLDKQISSLINQESIRNLLIRQSPHTSNGTNRVANTQLLAGYALTLLRCFPRKADDIRMWLYLGPTNKRTDDQALPATQYFWSAARSSSVFGTIEQNSRTVLPLIKTPTPTAEMRDDWTVILVFLELYTFLLKIMDDEEFVGSGRRPSAIPLTNVADLVTFLKNLGFVLYFNASDLNNTDTASAAKDGQGSSLSRHFGHGTLVAGMPKKDAESKPLVVAGLSGLTIDYLKGLVTGLLRAIYERDSRRHFLPADHWLLTSRFNMEQFIPGVVAEEESRHQVQEQDDEDKDDTAADSDDEPAGGIMSGAGARAGALRSQENRARAQRKASRKRYLESVAPRLEILQNMPFFIPFTTRVEIFRQFVGLDQEKRRNGHTDPDLWRQSMFVQATQHGVDPRHMLARHHAKIRRKNEFDDAFREFYDLGASLKEPIQITFVDEFDIAEAGIDGGGVTKEFLTSVINQAFDVESDTMPEKFFVENDKHLLYPNPTALEDLKLKWQSMGFPQNHPESRAAVKELLQQYEFLGRIIGKCLYEGILVDVNFAGFFLKKWALTGGTGQATLESGYRANINDLRDLDEGLYKGLLSLKNAPADEVESLGLTFTVDDMIGPDEKKQVVERELIPNGANEPVTAQNRLLYINAISRYRLQGQSAAQTNAFLRGLGSIVQPSWLNMFNQSELQTLIGGSGSAIDVADLRRNTLYGGTYVVGDDDAEHPSIQLFWNVMEKLPDADRRAVLKFVTSTPRGPLLGFEYLNPRFSIRDSGSDEGRWPSTSTCVNLLKLPMYRSEEVMKSRLLAAVRSGAGFDLS
ncbi:ubiquitin-protein ligase (E3) [Saxophila tyrrhenica]|uniref:HECT-type E3 ubiquitin transferase n=1 Tax=Saxophila tyrrhenica TaxID=1690608 RepID=A0AAV9PKY6_9PEZI|nr:ubiquitin-protein ligase (E3) [Saxophila tyrrhenica]